MCVCSQLTLKDLETFLTKTGFAKHYGEHFGEFRELILFRMASLCYCRDDEDKLSEPQRLMNWY